MSDATKEILFEKSMTADKRAPGFCYKRQGLFSSHTKGMYPSQAFKQENPNDLVSGQVIEDFVGTEKSSTVSVIVRDVNDVKLYNLGNDTLQATKTNVDYECGVYGDDGRHIVLDDDKVYRIGSSFTEIGTFTGATPRVALFDGLKYWYISRDEIYSQIGDGVITIAFNDLGFTPDFAANYGDQMIIVGATANRITIVFWDKSDPDLFDKRITIYNAELIAFGNLGGFPKIVYGVGNSTNVKERDGEIVVADYNGQNFERSNSIRAGDNEVRFESTRAVSVGNEIMLVSLRGNDANDTHNPELYQNFLLKIHKDSSIEVLTTEDGTNGDIDVVHVDHAYILYATNGGTEPRVMSNESIDSDYDDYDTDEAIYITNFLNNTYNLHKLKHISVSFEKLFEQTSYDGSGNQTNGEQLDVYYRVSERDDFTFIGTVNAQKVKDNMNQNKDMETEYNDDKTGLPGQMYQFTEIEADDEANRHLPEFNEIQFKFVSKKGFSVIQAWYGYDYRTRIPIN